MKKYILFFIVCFSLSTSIFSQVKLSVYSEISIVTAGPGTALYEAFGHSAIRIKDPVLRLDLIYNYGVFDFNQPNFYTNFAKGHMLYTLARYDFKYFIASYNKDKRWLKQQVLNLTQQQKQAFFMYLEKNALPENAAYLYDPYFDNCATILRDITDDVLGDKVQFNDNYANKNLSFRDLTNNEIHWNTWGSFGLNLIAGIQLDKKPTSKQYLFLPDYVFDSFKNAKTKVNGESKNLVLKEETLLNFKEKKAEISIFNPLLIISLLSLLGIFITYKNFKNNKRSKYIDFSLFFISGFIGCILCFFWFFSSHTTAPHNYNVLWAFPLNIIVAFLALRAQFPKKILLYLKFLLALFIFIPILWIFGIQVYPLALIPFLIFIVTRYLFLIKISE
ncbi:lipoprotein N-acyltransferase Lnb domain-containing protein [Polaribacter porphyrae]|uniref:Uncharacterized protein n=1 Tax=Polaribacter porphyrae TaxID=1137780 RepID=A0A2S7WJL8_9FLAO|nr:DUF4105 domain-containing protein [Polaribacter porphyrae]PQJ77807.1 hypothetical protein BTO18_00785 [Polaribacter porphyrae]